MEGNGAFGFIWSLNHQRSRDADSSPKTQAIHPLGLLTGTTDSLDTGESSRPGKTGKAADISQKRIVRISLFKYVKPVKGQDSCETLVVLWPRKKPTISDKTIRKSSNS